MSRPPLPDGDSRESVIAVRVRASAKTRLVEAAKKEGVSISELVRRILSEWVRGQ